MRHSANPDAARLPLAKPRADRSGLSGWAGAGYSQARGAGAGSRRERDGGGRGTEQAGTGACGESARRQRGGEPAGEVRAERGRRGTSPARSHGELRRRGARGWRVPPGEVGSGERGAGGTPRGAAALAAGRGAGLD